MKKLLLSFALFITAISFAQVPQGISYQAIALNGSGNPVVSSNVGVRLSVLDNTATGTVLYSETHTKMTNPQGLFNLVIGLGTPVTGTFAAINWGTNSKYFKVELDAAGGTNYVLTGTTQLLSVPYAMYAASTASIPAAALNGLSVNTFKSSSFVIASGTTVKGLYNGVWSTQTFPDYVEGSNIIESKGNFVIASGTTVKGFANGVWSTQTFPDYVEPETIFGENGSFVVANGTTVRGFYNGVWTTQSFNDYVDTNEVFKSNGSFVVLDGTTVKGFANGVWTTQSFSDYVDSNEVISSNGNFIVLDGNGVKAFFNGVWSTQPMPDYVYPTDVISSEKN